MIKNSANVHIRFVHFIVYNLYLKKTLKEEETSKQKILWHLNEEEKRKGQI